jgi:hypothetical protein
MAAVKSSRHSAARSTRSRPKSRHEIAPRPLKADELLELLSSRLALVETCSVALRSLDEDPDVGSISQALAHAAVLLGQAHESVGLFIQRVRS